MPAAKIKVIDYSGYRGEETPRSFVLQGAEIKVSEILNMWIEEGIENKVRKRFFHVKGIDGYEYKIYYDEKMKEWFIIKR